MDRYGLHVPEGWARWFVMLGLVAAANGLVVGWASAADPTTGLSETTGGAEAALEGSWSPQGPMQATLIHSQDFEGPAFPPSGWSRYDVVAEAQGVPPIYVWSRETCSVHPTRGGSAAAWAVGDGSSGAGLPCGGNYGAAPDMIDSWLAYTGIDLSGYAGGMQVNLDYRLDEPRDWSFLVCADSGSASLSCFASPVNQTNWTAMGSMHFAHVAGDSDARLLINFKDRDSSGSHFSVFIDNVVIEGLSAAMTSTPTDTESPTTPTATHTPSLTPTTTDTVEPTDTLAPSTTPSPTVTLTPLPTATNSPTPSATTTTLPSLTPSRTSTPSATATPSSTATPSETPSATHTTAAPPTVPASLTPSATPEATSTATSPTPGASATATSFDTPPATSPVTVTSTHTPVTTLPPPLTSVPTDTVQPSSTATSGTDQPATPTDGTPGPEQRIFLPLVFTQAAQ